MTGARTPAPVVITDPRRVEIDPADAYNAATFAEEARVQVHSILSALRCAIDNDEHEAPRPYVDAALLLLKRPLAIIGVGTTQVRVSLGSVNDHLSQPLDLGEGSSCMEAAP